MEAVRTAAALIVVALVGWDFERFANGNACMDCHQHKKIHADDAHPNGRFTNAQCIDCHTQSR